MVNANRFGAKPSAAENESKLLFDQILGVCSKLVFATWQQKQVATFISDVLRTSGRKLRFAEIQPFRDLHERNKLVRLSAGSIRELTAKQRKLFQGRTHKHKVVDDIQLYETAISTGHLVIMDDLYLLRKQGLWDSQLKVQTVLPSVARQTDEG